MPLQSMITTIESPLHTSLLTDRSNSIFIGRQSCLLLAHDQITGPCWESVPVCRSRWVM